MMNGIKMAADITHVIFDLDGLLIDTEVLYTTCTQAILDPYGKKYTSELKMKVMGRPRMESARVIIEATGIPYEPQQFTHELYDLLYTQFPSAQYMPGALEIVQHLHAHGVPLALATGSHTEAYDSKISEKPELVKCFSHSVCSDNPLVKAGKPSPDIFLVAINGFSHPPASMSNVLVFEDAPNGVSGAVAAGMKVIMVPDPSIDPSLTLHATRVYKSLLDVNLTEWGLPPLSNDNNFNNNNY